jgi:ABC-type multidrug transport system fused ATPase/permease subunit
MSIFLKKIWGLFSSRGRKQLLLLAVMMTVAAGLEMVGIGALLPIIGIMQRPDLIQTNRFLSGLSELLGNPSQQNFFIILLVFLLLLFMAKNVFVLFLSAFQFKFFAKEQAALSTKLLSSYLGRPYTFHLQANSAQLLRTVTTDVGNVYYLSMTPLMGLISESLVTFAVFILIVAIDPAAAIFSLCIGGVMLICFYRLLRGRMARIGRDIQTSGGKMMQYAQEGLGGIKEIKVLSREVYFQAAFSKQIGKYTDGMKKSNVINALPRLVLETLFILIFVGVLLILTLGGRLENALPLMAVYAASAFRLIPSLNKVMNAMSLINMGRASIDTVIEDLSKIADGTRLETKCVELSFQNSIVLECLRYRYPNAENDAIRQISLTIQRGEMVGFMGKSGSGKTTLIDIILGLLTPSSGSVMVDGQDIQQCLNIWQRKIGYIPQTIYLTDDTLRRNIALGLSDDEIVEKNLWRALDASQLSDFVRLLPDGLDTVVGERGVRLSGGQRQRIGIARAMYYNPEVLILDEATSALDTETEKEIVKTVRSLQGSKTILIIAHRLTTVEGCDRIFYLRDGALYLSGSFKDVTASIESENYDEETR